LQLQEPKLQFDKQIVELDLIILRSKAFANKRHVHGWARGLCLVYPTCSVKGLSNQWQRCNQWRSN